VTRAPLGISAACIGLSLSLTPHALGEPRPDGAPVAPPAWDRSSVVVDRAVVRFYAPETGGTAQPRFIDERCLSFEARLEEMSADQDGIGDGYREHDVRAAIEHHVAEEMLASLARRLIIDSPAEKRPTEAELEGVERDFTSATLERLGGRARVDEAARAEALGAQDTAAILQRGAMAAWYIDRAMTPILHPGEEQLREVYRTAAHPYRGQPLDQIRRALERWFVVERVRVAESAFLQSARARVKIIVLP
jgi:hypothetical protein